MASCGRGLMRIICSTFSIRLVVWRTLVIPPLLTSACGKVYSRGQVFYDRERLSGLASTRRPQTAGDLMQFFQAVNWLRTVLPRLAEIVEPLRVLLK